MSLFREYYELISSLTDRQLTRLGTVQWLLDESNPVRKSGRSLLMALSFARDASIMPRRWVKVWDHDDPNRMGRRRMIDMIDGFFPTRFELGDGAIMAHEGWLQNRLDRVIVNDLGSVRQMLIGDVRSAAVATLRAGVPVEEIVEAVKEALVQSVMEA